MDLKGICLLWPFLDFLSFLFYDLPPIFRFPVQSMVQYPNGTILSGLNANELFDVAQNSSITSRYASFMYSVC